MSQPRPSSRETGRKMETFIGTLLRTGVILAATVVLAGAVVFLARHGRDALSTTRFSASRRTCAP